MQLKIRNIRGAEIAIRRRARVRFPHLRSHTYWIRGVNEIRGVTLEGRARQASLTTKCGGGRGVSMAPAASFFLLGAFRLICFRACRQFASYSREIIENLQFTVQIEIFPKNTLFCPTTTYSGLCSSDHPCMKTLFLVWFLGLGVIYSEKVGL